MKIIGHRGARGLAPENTVEGLKKALEHHVDAVEVDVRITADGVAVLLHDAEASDPAGDKLLVRGHTLKELQAHKPNMPTLEEALRFVARRVPVIIELKPNEPTEPVIDVVRQLLAEGWQTEDLAFISFDYRILKVFRREFPEHLLIVDEMWSGIRATSRARRLGSKDISLYTPFLWTGFVRAVSSRGYRLYSFPLNDTKKSRRWQKAGFYGAITDFPDLFEN